MFRDFNTDNKQLILGAGITGLSLGIKTGGKIYEAKDIPGGICASYYIDLKGRKSYSCQNEETYRFELGGGHWIFGADNKILSFINSLSPVKTYQRKSAVYFADLDLYVPYPIQNHLFYLPKDIRAKALDEILHTENKTIFTVADWLEVNFGKTLCNLFFFPFHELYTAGLYKKIAPQDKFKTPANKDLILKGAKEKTPSVGYNATFVYPQNGLDDLIRRMAKRCKVNFNKRVIKINVQKKEILFKDGTSTKYKSVISTLPLNKITEMAGIGLEEPITYTSVLEVNIGAKRGRKCPDYHWLYIPKSEAGFFRVGFYSNVDNSFLPVSSRKNNNKVSIYVEKAFAGGEKLKETEIKKLCNDIVKELKEWNFISEVEVISPTWIEVAYTWQYPNSNWREKVIKILRENQISQTGRYGKWKFQGIADSIKDGLEIKKAING